MGRGRAKAKQTKVARQLKYSNHDIDYEQLREELRAGGDPEDKADRHSGPPGDEVAGG